MGEESPNGIAIAPEAQALASDLVAAGGGQVRAVLLYGSQLLRTRPDRHSAYDFVALVHAYRAFYEALRASGQLHRPARLMAALARTLPPNTIAFAPDGERGGIAKCLIVSSEDFERALGPEPPDHFLVGRLVQRVGAVWSKSPEDSAWVAGQIEAARGRVLSWMTPYLNEPVDAEALGRRLLEVCYAAELRPEAKDRFDRISEAQAEHFRVVLGPVLEEGAASGLLVRDGQGYSLSRPVPPSERRRWRRHFRRSKLRATARWLKHMVTFANWLPYIVHKVERHSGRRIELTFLERKLPIVFLWPRAIYVLLTRPRRELES